MRRGWDGPETFEKAHRSEQFDWHEKRTETGYAEADQPAGDAFAEIAATGIWLVRVAGHEFTDVWIIWALVLFAFAGLCWLPVVALQIRMFRMAQCAQGSGQPLPQRYWKMERWWVILGALAFPALVVVFWLMVFRPV